MVIRNRIRVERYKTSMLYTEAFDLVSTFYRKHGDDSPQNASEGFKSGRLMGSVVDFPKNVVLTNLDTCVTNFVGLYV